MKYLHKLVFSAFSKLALVFICCFIFICTESLDGSDGENQTSQNIEEQTEDNDHRSESESSSAGGIQDLFDLWKANSSNYRTLQKDFTKLTLHETVEAKNFYVKNNPEKSNAKWNSWRSMSINKNDKIFLTIDSDNLPSQKIGVARPDLKPDEVHYLFYRIDPRLKEPQIVRINTESITVGPQEDLHDAILRELRNPNNYENENAIRKTDNDPINILNKTITSDSTGSVEENKIVLYTDKDDLPISVGANKVVVLYLEDIFPKNAELENRDAQKMHFDNILGDQGAIAYQAPSPGRVDSEKMDFSQEDFSCPARILRKDFNEGEAFHACAKSCQGYLMDEKDLYNITGEHVKEDSLAIFNAPIPKECQKCLDVKEDKEFYIDIPKSQQSVKSEVYNKYYFVFQDNYFDDEKTTVSDQIKGFYDYLDGHQCFNKKVDIEMWERIGYEKTNIFEGGIWSPSYTLVARWNKYRGFANCKIPHIMGLASLLNNTSVKFLHMDIPQMEQDGDGIHIAYGANNEDSYSNKDYWNVWDPKQRGGLDKINTDPDLYYSGHYYLLHDCVGYNDSLDSSYCYNVSRRSGSNSKGIAKWNEAKHRTVYHTQIKKKYEVNCKCRNTIITPEEINAMIKARGDHDEMRAICDLVPAGHYDEVQDATQNNRAVEPEYKERDKIAILSPLANSEACMKIMHLDESYEWGDEYDSGKSILARIKSGKREFLNLGTKCQAKKIIGVESGYHTFTGAPSSQIFSTNNINDIDQCTVDQYKVDEHNSKNAPGKLCLFKNGTGISITTDEQSFGKSSLEEFTQDKATKKNKRFLYFTNDAQKNKMSLSKDAKLQIKDMFFPSEIRQFAKDWDEENPALITPKHNKSFFDDNQDKLFRIAHLYFGSYLIRVEIYSKLVAPQKIDIEYQISENRPSETDSRSLCSFDLLKPENNEPCAIETSSSGGFWYRVISDQEITNGSLDITIEKTKVTDFFEKYIYKTILKQIIATIQEHVAMFFSSLTDDPSLKHIARVVTTLYVIFYGIFFLTGMIQLSFNDLLLRVIKVIVVSYALFDNNSWNFFNKYVFRLFLEGYQQFTIFLLSPNFTVESLNDPNPFSWVDVLLSKYFSAHTWNMIFFQLFFSVGYFIITAILISALVKFLFMIFKVTMEYTITFMMLAISISLAPFFIILILFDYTRQIFMQWVKLILGMFLFSVILITLVLLAETVFFTFFANAILPQTLKLHVVYLPIDLIIFTLKIPIFWFWWYNPGLESIYTISQQNLTTVLIYTLLFYFVGEIYSKISNIVSSINGVITGFSGFNNG